MKTKQPLVSIIMAAYQREEFIAEAIESVIAQDYENWELIIVDDGSTDNTKIVVRPYLEDPRISYSFKENGGQSSALNAGAKIASGEFLAFIDSDNRWLPERLHLSISEFEKFPEAIVTYGNIITIDERGREISRKNMRRRGGLITAKLLFDNFVTFNTSTIRKSAFDRIGGFNGELQRAPDYDMWLRISTLGPFQFIDSFLAEYRVMEDQISSNKEARFNNNFSTLKRFKQNFPDALNDNEWSQGFSAFFNRRARYYLSIGERRKALRQLALSFREKFTWQAPWKTLIKCFLPGNSV